MSRLRNDADGGCAFARASTAFRPPSRVGDASFWSDRWEIFQKKKAQPTRMGGSEREFENEMDWDDGVVG
jgi:hypothetical protein